MEENDQDNPIARRQATKDSIIYHIRSYFAEQDLLRYVDAGSYLALCVCVWLWDGRYFNRVSLLTYLLSSQRMRVFLSCPHWLTRSDPHWRIGHFTL